MLTVVVAWSFVPLLVPLIFWNNPAVVMVSLSTGVFLNPAGNAGTTPPRTVAPPPQSARVVGGRLDYVAAPGDSLTLLWARFGVDPETAAKRYTKIDSKGKTMLRHRRDTIFETACTFLDQKERRCTVYNARPGVCRKFPESSRCGYYEFLKFEREQQGDEEWVALT